MIESIFFFFKFLIENIIHGKSRAHKEGAYTHIALDGHISDLSSQWEDKL